VLFIKTPLLARPLLHLRRLLSAILERPATREIRPQNPKPTPQPTNPTQDQDMEPVNMHDSGCPKCGAASDGSAKSCGSCGAVSSSDLPYLPYLPYLPPARLFTHLLNPQTAELPCLSRPLHTHPRPPSVTIHQAMPRHTGQAGTFSSTQFTLSASSHEEGNGMNGWYLGRRGRGWGIANKQASR
jgi:hypothetical protein